MSVGSLNMTINDQHLLFSVYNLDRCALEGRIQHWPLSCYLLSFPRPPCLFAITDGVWSSRKWMVRLATCDPSTWWVSSCRRWMYSTALVVGPITIRQIRSWKWAKKQFKFSATIIILLLKWICVCLCRKKQQVHFSDYTHGYLYLCSVWFPSLC